MKHLVLASLLLVLGYPISSNSQDFSTNSVFAGGVTGTGDNFGSGWTPDGLGGVTGTGDNFGSGWAPDGLGDETTPYSHQDNSYSSVPYGSTLSPIGGTIPYRSSRSPW